MQPTTNGLEERENKDARGGEWLTGGGEVGARFSKFPKSFRTWKAIAKSRNSNRPLTSASGSYKLLFFGYLSFNRNNIVIIRFQSL